jgi:hypothetical protein
VAVLESFDADRSSQCGHYRYRDDGIRSRDGFRTI